MGWVWYVQTVCHPVFGNPRQSGDSLAFWISRCGFWIAGTGFQIPYQWNLDSGWAFQSLRGVRIPWAEFWIPKSTIPYSRGKHFSRFRIPQAKFSGFRIQITLPGTKSVVIVRWAVYKARVWHVPCIPPESPVAIVSLAVVIRVVTQRWGGTLRYDPNNGCEGDYKCRMRSMWK